MEAMTVIIVTESTIVAIVDLPKEYPRESREVTTGQRVLHQHVLRSRDQTIYQRHLVVVEGTR